MSKVSRRENIPGEPPEQGVLYVAPPLARTRGTLRRLLWDSGLPFGDPMEDVLAVEVGAGGLPGLGDALLKGLTRAELKDCRAILVEKGARVDLGMLPRMQDLYTLLNCARETRLKEILREDRLTVHFQPIVAVENPQEVFAYECLFRGVDENGASVDSEQMFEAARAAGLLYNLDRAARVKALRETAGRGIRDNIFIDYCTAAVYDPEYCLEGAMEVVEESGLSPQKIVFEVTDAEKMGDVASLKRIVGLYRGGGFGVALSDLGSGYSSLDLLAELRPDFVKLDVSLVGRPGGGPYEASNAGIIRRADELGVTVVAEGVETEGQWRWVAAHGADYAQGHLFTHAASPPPVPAQTRTRQLLDHSRVPE